jgi:threonine-phosphate decarboxylase
MKTPPSGPTAPRAIAVDRIHGGVAPEGALDFSASLNPLGPPPEALDAYHQASALIGSYPPPHPRDLERKFANWIGVDPERVIAGNGSVHLIYLLVRVLRTTRPYIVIPTFSEIANALAVAGSLAHPIQLSPASGFALKIAPMYAALKAGADAIWLGRPNSPTGTCIEEKVALEIGARCLVRNAWCVFDEAFIDLASGVRSLAPILKRNSRAIVLRSLTKSFAIPGIRLGFAIADPELIARMREAIEPWSVNAAAEMVARACLDLSSDYLNRARYLIEVERAFIQRELSSIAGLKVLPTSANFMMVEVSREPPRGAFAAHMAKHKIAIRDLAELPGCGSGMYRIAVRAHPDNERLVAAARLWKPS